MHRLHALGVLRKLLAPADVWRRLQSAWGPSRKRHTPSERPDRVPGQRLSSATGFGCCFAYSSSPLKWLGACSMPNLPVYRIHR